MPSSIFKVPSIDTQPSRGVGVKLPFSPGSVFSTTYNTKEALKTNITNFLLTNQGERYLNPKFGADLRALLFEQMTPSQVADIKEKIKEGVRVWFPNVVVSKLNVTPNVESQSIEVSLGFQVPYTNIEDTININFET